MSMEKTVNSPLASHFKLTSRQCSTNAKEKKRMKNVSYAPTVGSLIYVMVCTRLDITDAVGVVSRFLSNPSTLFWLAVKWIFRYLRSMSNMC